MKVSISVPGRFWLFNLARQLIKKGYLNQLITSYPKFEVVKYGIPKNKVDSVIIKEILTRGWNELPNFIKQFYDPRYLICNIFENAATRLLKKSDIVVGGSTVSLEYIRKSKQQGAVTVIEHGSSHPRFQKRILEEEYEKYNINKILIHPKILEKSEKEFDETDYIFIPSSYVKRTFIERGFSEDKLIQVPYGVDLSEFKQIKKKDDVFRVIFVGGMSLRKGVHYLLQAFTELNLPNSELMLIGSINDEIKPFFKKYKVEKSKKQEISKSINQGSKIRFIGHVPQKELYKYYSQGSVFVIMSIEEGLALVQPQAMACGLPVICTTNTGGEDIIRKEKDGFVIPIRDMDALKEKLVYLYENSGTLKEMGKSAKKRVSSGFTWDDYGDRIIKEYKRILSYH